MTLSGSLDIMETASEKLFGIPELTTSIAVYLEMGDLVRFMQTCRQVYTVCVPLLYNNHLDMIHTHGEMVFSEDSLQALARNAHSLRSLRMDDYFLNFVYKGLLEANPDLPPLDVGEATSVSVRDIPLPPLKDPQTKQTPAIYKTIPFQPIRQLRSILLLTLPIVEVWRDPLQRRQGIDIAQICHLIQLNPLLDFLTVNQVRIRTQDELDLLARTVSGMTNLKQTWLSIVAPEAMVHRVIPTIFLCLPRSATFVTFTLSFQRDEPSDLPPPAPAMETAADLMTALSEQQDPLPGLLELEIAIPVFMSPEMIFAIFGRCPNLERIDVPRVERAEDVERVAEFIVKHCPKIQEISQEDPTYDTSGSLILAIADRLPEDSLTWFYMEGYNENEAERLGASLLRHCYSLRKIIFRKCQRLSSVSIDMILEQCSVLDMFEINGETPHTFALDLRQATREIASPLLEELWLAVKTDEMLNEPTTIEIINQVDMRLYHQDGPQILREVIEPYEEFYRAIGALTRLRVLDLRVAVPPLVPRQPQPQPQPQTLSQTQQDNADDSDSDSDMDSDADADADVDPNSVGLEPVPERDETFRDRCFPGLMTLGKELPGGHRGLGYLGLLQGLKNLEELRGSFSVDVYRRHGQNIGENEVQWMATHWPKLKVAEFFPKKKRGGSAPKVDEHFEWLQTELPDLEVTLIR
ncbi:hypothetical protein BGX33_008976 [Mortierella sp. NVP41]|nr:hypothetical protein BGX33_008976 [Mortierella sp. NVP41]